jgi:hypothetical protein
MPTENRRVAAYLPKHIDDRLESFKIEHGLKGDSPALIAILEEFFGVSQQVAHTGNTPLSQRVDALESKVNDLASDLTQRLQELSEAIESTRIEAEPLNRMEASLINDLGSSLLSELRSELFNELRSKPPVSELPLASPGQLSLLKHKDDTENEPTNSIFNELKSSLPSELLDSEGNAAVSDRDEPLDERSSKPLDGNATWSGVELSKRLKIGSSEISSRKDAPAQKLAEWSQSKDPDGLAWKRISKGKYVPIVDASEEF